MLQSQTAVIERNAWVSGDFATEPFEVAWAREAKWYFQILDGTGVTSISVHTQVSPDGITWVDLGDAPVIAGDAPLTTWDADHFGHWLRVRGTVNGDTSDAGVTARIYLALKS